MEQQEERPWYSCLYSSPSPLYHQQQQQQHHPTADPLDSLAAVENHSSPHHQLSPLERSHEYQCSPLHYSNHQRSVLEKSDNQCLQLDYTNQSCPSLEHGGYQCSPVEHPNLHCSSTEGSSLQCSPVHCSPLERSNLPCSTLENFGIQPSPLEQPLLQSSTQGHSNVEQNAIVNSSSQQAQPSNHAMFLQYMAPSSQEHSALEATPGVLSASVETPCLETVALETPLVETLETPRLVPSEAPGLDLMDNGGVEGLSVVASSAAGGVDTVSLEHWNAAPLDHWNSPAATTHQQHPTGVEESSSPLPYQDSIPLPVADSHFHHPAASDVLEPNTVYDPTAGGFIHTFAVKVEEQDDDEDGGGGRLERFSGGGRCSEVQRGDNEMKGIGNMWAVRMGNWPEEHNNNNNNRYDPVNLQKIAE